MYIQPIIKCNSALKLWCYSSVGALSLYLYSLTGFGSMLPTFIMHFSTFIALMVAIKQDPSSGVQIVLAVSGLVSLATFGGSLVIPVLIMFSLLFGGLSLSERFHVVDEEEEIDLSESSLLLRSSAVFGALFVAIMANIFIPEIKFSTQSILSLNTFFGSFPIFLGASPKSLLNFSSLDPTTQGQLLSAFLLVGFTVPVAEEQFFRAFFGNWFLSRTNGNIGLAAPANGVLFAGFHVAVLGLNQYSLAIIAVNGAVFTFIDWVTGEVATSTFAHIGNNSMTFLVGGNIFVFLFPQLGVFAPQFILPIALLAVTVIVKREKVTTRLVQIWK